jgi:hypothetical protein
MTRSIGRFTFLAAVGAVVLLAGRASAQRPAPPCCTITAIDTRNGVVSAKVTTSGEVFEFKASSPRTLGTMRVGQAVYANFASNQISLDGRTMCCTVTKAPAQAAAPAVRPAPVAAPSRTTAAPNRTTTVPGIAANVARTAANLPQVTYGEQIPVTSTSRRPVLAARFETRMVNARVGGRSVSAEVLHINGPQGVRNAPIPDGARRLIEMHMRKLPQGQSQYYLVNPQMAAEWLATHPVPPEVKPKEESNSDSDCGDISINGIRDCGQDAVSAVEDEFERARKRAEDWWNESTEELADQWNESKSCFADHTLPGPRTPVRFSITPSMTVNMAQSGSRGTAKGTLKGSVRLGIPMQSDFQAKVEFFYIPCLPFVVRPKSLTADGGLTVGQQLTVDVESTGSFNKTFTIPPTGGPQIPLYVIPIVIGNVPVAVLDVSAYIEGEVEVDGTGKASGRFAVTNSHRSDFDFSCNGNGCSGNQKGNTAPVTTNESAQIEGKVSVQPGIYTALQLNFDYNVLSARAGPQPYLLGTATGCGAAQGTQTAGGQSSSQLNAALTADLDWGVKIRAEALAGGQRIGERWEESVMRDKHLWFRDLLPGGSSALVAAIEASTPAVAAQPAGFKVRLPSCYPYTSPVQYRITWAGGATPATNPACQFQSGGGNCRFDPAKDLALSLTWPSEGNYSVSVMLVKDDHRTFSPAPRSTQLGVTVGPAGGGQP